MDWNLFGSIAIAIFLIRWEQNKITILSLCKELIILGLFVFLLSTYLNGANISLSLFSHLPEKMEVWMSAIIMASFVLCLSYKSWKSLHVSIRNHRHQKS